MVLVIVGCRDGVGRELFSRDGGCCDVRVAFTAEDGCEDGKKYKDEKNVDEQRGEKPAATRPAVKAATLR